MSFLSTLQDNIENIATLNITTSVGPAIPNGKKGGYIPADGSKIMYSSIDLIQGDIKSIIPEEFLTAEYASIRQYHQAREDTGREIIKENIECLKSLVALVEKLGSSKSEK